MGNFTINDLIELKYDWMVNSNFCSRMDTLCYCFQLAQDLGASITFNTFSPMTGTVRVGNRKVAFEGTEELKAVLVVWKE